MKGMNSQDKLVQEMIAELNGSELMLQSEDPYEENYQLKMIRENPIPGLLKVTACHKDSYGQYLYSISGLTTLEKKFEKTPCHKEDIQKFLSQLMELIEQLNNYLLDLNYIILDPKYIFVKEEKYFFCYYPKLNKEIIEGFHELSEYWIKVIDYEDYGSVAYACGIHKKTMEECYDLENLIEIYTECEHQDYEINTIQDPKNWNVQEERLKLQCEDSLWEDIWEDEDSSEEVEKISKMGNILRETSIGKYFEQRKKERWGDWDDLLTQEESFIMNRRSD